MKVTVEINDKVWADFCIYVESDHGKNCKCKTRGLKDIDVALSAMIAINLIDYKQMDFMANAKNLIREEFGIPEDIQEFDRTKIDPIKMFAILGRLAEADMKAREKSNDLAEQYEIPWYRNSQ